MINKQSPNYRWYILAITGLTYAVIAGANRLCMPVLFKEIGDELNLSVAAIGAVWGMDPLAGVFIGLPAGLLADRFGVKRALTVLCILAGIFGALRGFSTGFLSMSVTMFLFGLTAAATPSIVPKATADWFSGKRLALTNAILNVMWSLGAMTATMFSAAVFSPLLGGWRNVLFVYGIPSVLLGMLWLFTARDPDHTLSPSEAPPAQVPFKQALSHVIRIKEVWIIGIITLFNWGASMGLVGYLPLYLEEYLGWSKVSAGSTITVLSGMMLLGSIPMVLISDRLGSRKGVLHVAILALALCLFLLPYVNSTGIWLLIIFSAFLRAGAGSLFNVMIFETKGIGSIYAGTAIGLANTVSMLGAFLSPPIGNSLESISPGLPFTFWGVLAALSIPLMFLIKTPEKPAY